jgi:hypothetical protein
VSGAEQMPFSIPAEMMAAVDATAARKSAEAKEAMANAAGDAERRRVRRDPITVRTRADVTADILNEVLEVIAAWSVDGYVVAWEPMWDRVERETGISIEGDAGDHIKHAWRRS